MSGHNNGATLDGRVIRRGTSNSNARGSVEDRRRRREWLVATYRADVDLLAVRRMWEFDDASFVVEARPAVDGQIAAYESEELDDDPDVGTFVCTTATVVPACRCYRCGRLLTVETVTVDRIVPGVKGGTYRRSNIRPACGSCNSETGAPLARRLTR